MLSLESLVIDNPFAVVVSETADHIITTNISMKKLEIL